MHKTVTMAAVIIGLWGLVGCRPADVSQPSQDEPPPSVDDTDFRPIDAVVEAEIAAGHFPGAVVLVGQADKTLYYKAFGHSVIEPFERPARPDDIFDLASLTKPVATAASVLMLADRGHIDLEDKVAHYIPDFAANGKDDVRIKHLLSHTSVLPAYTSAAALSGRQEVLAKIYSLKAQSEPGSRMRYSCLGYIVLSRIVEIVADQSLAEFSRDNLFLPLGMSDTFFLPSLAYHDRIAGVSLRDGRLQPGVVHDPLAGRMGGVSGNAGLYSTAGDLAVFCRMLLNDGFGNGRQILSGQAVALLTGEQAFGRAYGFDVSSSYSKLKGEYFSPAAFCHTGYTGTSIVCDPDTKVFVIILTNRVHPDTKGKAGPVRVALSDIVAQMFGDTPQSVESSETKNE